MALCKSIPKYTVLFQVQQFISSMRNLFLLYHSNPNDLEIISAIKEVYRVTKRTFTNELVESVTEIEDAEQLLDQSLFLYSFNTFLEDSRQLLRDKQVQLFCQQLIRTISDSPYFYTHILDYDY